MKCFFTLELTYPERRNVQLDFLPNCEDVLARADNGGPIFVRRDDGRHRIRRWNQVPGRGVARTGRDPRSLASEASGQGAESRVPERLASQMSRHAADAVRDGKGRHVDG